VRANAFDVRAQGADSRRDYQDGLKAERKTVAEKPAHRELADEADARSSADGTVVGSEHPAHAGKHGRKYKA